MLKKKEPISREPEQEENPEVENLNQKLKQYELRFLAQEEQQQLRDEGTFRQVFIAQLARACELLEKMNELLEKMGRIQEGKASLTEEPEEDEEE